MKQKKPYDLVIGIDPDVEKSGIAFVSPASRSLEVDTMSFFLLLEELSARKSMCDKCGYNYVVVIEAGHMIKTNWHVNFHMTTSKAAALGESAGRNHEVGILIGDYCSEHGINYIYQMPLKKCWKGSNGKITHDELVTITSFDKLRSNQEERDAALLAWMYAQLPIKMF